MTIVKFFRAALVATLLSTGIAQTAQAAIVTFAGNTAGAPTYNRLVQDGSDLSVIGTAVTYNALNFSVAASGEYTFVNTGDLEKP